MTGDTYLLAIAAIGITLGALLESSKLFKLQGASGSPKNVPG